ncbi:helix-hairpin-helix domain-containing protein [Aquipuribacter hungaricus]|uniref:ComEA family DNA-binding protein n=1 Tax=Aquipuribacter hungaricus TaxID=545624 RepID=A0ABV7WF54_9MICO
MPAGRWAGWRLGGVPGGAAVVLAAVAVATGVLLLGGGAGDEVLVGPASVTAPAVAGQADDGEGGAAGADAVEAVPVAGSVSSGGGGGPVAGPSGEPGLVYDAGGANAGGTAGGAPAAGASVAQAGPLVVHVDGAVEQPGVVTVPAGSRVADAVAAAGGVTAEADTRLVNLARPLADGELVVVPLPGEAAQPGTGGAPGPGTGSGAAGSGGGDSGGAGPGGAGGPAAGGLLDVNTADAAALDALPGIGPVLAARIVEHRDAVGPFASVDDLGSVSGIGPAVLADIADLVTV